MLMMVYTLLEIKTGGKHMLLNNIYVIIYVVILLLLVKSPITVFSTQDRRWFDILQTRRHQNRLLYYV